MSSIQIDNGYLIINADTGGTNRGAGIISVSENDTACEITFDTEKAAGTVMDQLAEALCGRWLDAGMEEQLSQDTETIINMGTSGQMQKCV